MVPVPLSPAIIVPQIPQSLKRRNDQPIKGVFLETVPLFHIPSLQLFPDCFHLDVLLRLMREETGFGFHPSRFC